MDTTSPPKTPRTFTPGHAFVSVFISVFLLIFLGSGVITYTLPNVYTSQARVRSAPGPMDAVQSAEALGALAGQLDLNQKYAQRYGESGPLANDRMLQLLKRMIRVRPVRGTSLWEIQVQDLDPNEAAHLANALARASITNAADSQDPPQIIELAVPATRPTRPNRPLNLLLGAVVGAFLGVMSGGVAARLALGVTLRNGTRIQMTGPGDYTSQ